MPATGSWRGKPAKRRPARAGTQKPGLEFEKIVHYVTIDATKPDADWASLRKLLTLDAKRPRVFYLATSPHLYVDICRAIGMADLADEPARVVLEKPIGTDLEFGPRDQ